MGACNSVLRRVFPKKRKIKILMVGLDNAGKTCAVKNLLGELCAGVVPTVGFSKFSFHKHRFDVTIYDLGGGQSIRGIWKNYFAEVFAIVFVIDSNASDRIEECKETIVNLLDNPIITGKPMLLLANKQDMDGAMDEIDLCDLLDLENLVNSKRTPTRIETCSANQVGQKKQDKAIQVGFRWLIKTISMNWNALSARVEHDVERQNAAEENARKERMERVQKIREEREKNDILQNNSKADDDKNDDKIDNPFRPISEIKKDIVSKELENSKTAASTIPVAKVSPAKKEIKETTPNGEVTNSHQDHLIINCSELPKKDLDIQAASSPSVSSRIHSPTSRLIQVTPKHKSKGGNCAKDVGSNFSDDNKHHNLTSYIGPDSVKNSLVSVQSPDEHANFTTVVAQIERQDSDLVSEKTQRSLPLISPQGNFPAVSKNGHLSEPVSSPTSQEDFVGRPIKRKKKRAKLKKNKVIPAETSTEESATLETGNASSRFAKLPPLRVANASSSSAQLDHIPSFSSVDITKSSDDSDNGRMQWDFAEDLQTIAKKEDLAPS